MMRARPFLLIAFVMASAATSHLARADVILPPTPCTSSNPECAACDGLAAGDCCTLHGKQGACTEESGEGGAVPMGLVCIASASASSCHEAASSGSGGGCSVEPRSALEVAAPWMVVGLVPLLLRKRKRSS